MRKIGIFGGTFDPPHNGHLLMANEVLYKLDLDEIWFMPNQIPPHKQKNSFSLGMHRAEMLKLAISGKEQFKLETIELEREGPSYTFDTVRLLKDRYPNDKFYFIIGADMVEYLPKWSNIDKLVNMIQFVGVKRPGFQIETPYPLVFVDVPIFEVSSSLLRDRIKNQQPTDYLIPDEVKVYVKENHLYET
ncbi:MULTISPECIES: nicotinate-nucleotide adenylyltransferase [Bacillus]|uniref:nicotinate-nucleotide adenylyltransferase n=1 Tax=Bacillus TaxID=1386 RepID=UPI001C236959|nr:nicotinate-nucleotide adenylyltransferase [Bacillus paralicheniformis]MBU8581575.1 nicotinate-nucleotide adenylyltransferase [Bacillus paralicheniformis]MCY8039899.1 nicotinate-nucleotide adenylyltransferase [Bacillus paralicheniformis]MCY8151903.1 nicotinate-nucleotide adenylyltransferase [Bacillus paralicheniformis]MCY8179167.1 nicotinate-nucleotide adenylyltransferase [Bacillus paralicheniformis]MCY9421917.1 nicotinate-nucleotide adenylyltransferase [Bacillus paralicheniformis]